MNYELKEYLSINYTSKTAASYLREIQNYLANNSTASQYTYSQVMESISALRSKYTNTKTLHRILASIKAYYNFLCFVEIRKDNPSKAIQLKDKQSRDIQLQDLFSTAELEMLLQAKQERYARLNYRNKVLISLLIYQALKPQEIEQLKVENINLEQSNIYIKASAKNNSRTLQLKYNQLLLIKQYLEQARPLLLGKNTTDNFIIGQRNTLMTAEDITKHIKRHYNIYPPRKVNAQTIRQSVITNLLKQKIDLRIVQTFAGHKYPSTTERYKQTQVEELQAALKLYHPLK
jgi:integrase/recombinase XerD